ncbi:pilus assembly protein PapC [Vibrio vulnificus]|nr:pilus assembly protein PapC [Vibrio vulnificus]EIZ1173104.1 pilus assembly protein PapC [Vibrio vulnificus]EIZ1363098.1 pilus assembly protein PapC [Vibrio vulnificus]EKG2460529.1 pilus assembly protein PapC [Vibrio vulnificus]
MQRWWCVFLFLCLCPVSGFCADYRLSLPVWYSETQLGELPIEIEGMTLKSVSAEALNVLLADRISDTWWRERFAHQSGDFIHVEKWRELGVNFHLNLESLTVDLTLPQEALSERTLNASQQYPPFQASASGSVSWLNSFNFAYNRYWQNESESWYSSIDWLSQMNLGGVSGINLQLVNHLQMDEESHDYVRGEWLAFYDDPDLPLRASVGDVFSGESGHLYGLALGGFTVESRYADLQPERSISPQSSQQLLLQESAEVEVYVNGERVSSGRLEAGRYNLQNLILDNGANEITVVVNYLSGRQEVLSFTQFYNARLLQQDLLDYAFSVGRPIVYQEQGIEYEDAWLATGYLEYGVTDGFTLGGNGLWAKEGGVIGMLATVSSGMGNLTSRFSWSHNEDQGWVASLDYENSVIGNGESQSPNLRLAYEYSDQFQSKPWRKGEEGNQYSQILGSYFWQISDAVDLTLSGRYTLFDEKDDEVQTSVLLNWRHKGLTVGLGTEYEESARYVEGDNRLLLTFEYNWYSEQESHRIGASYNSLTERSRLYFNNEGLNYVDDIGVRIEAEQDQSIKSQKAMLSYTANRFRVESELVRKQNRLDDQALYQGSVRLATSLGMVDGEWGWGRALSGPFMVASMHPTLTEATAYLDVDSEGRATALATPSINGLIPISQPYGINIIEYNVHNAPLGYDWGAGKIDVSPGAATGHRLIMGSDASYTVTGFLTTTEGEAIAYRQASLIVDDKRMAFFTNQQGRFYIQGIAPGEYRLELSGLSSEARWIVIPESDNSLINLGQINVVLMDKSAH